MTSRGLAILVAAMVMATAGALVSAQSRGNRYSATLVPGQEVPSLSTTGAGSITVVIDDAAKEISYEMSYSGMTDVRQAHIHFGQPGVGGGIMLWLCKTATNPGPAGNTLPICPAEEGSVSGTLASADVLAVQRLAAGDFENAAKQIRLGLAYANVHTVASPGGEIRGQLHLGGAQK